MGIETSAGFISAALSVDGEIHSKELKEKNCQSEKLAQLVADLLQEAKIEITQIDRFACTTGPGSFTGIRSGLSFMQGISHSQGKKLEGVGTLEMMCGGVSGYVAVSAGKGKYYTQEFRDGEGVSEISLINEDELGCRRR